jgi:hypothetical protein
MQPNTLTRLECKGKIYDKNIRRNSCRIRTRIRIRNHLKSRIRIRKIHSGSTTLVFSGYNLLMLGTVADISKNNETIQLTS